MVAIGRGLHFCYCLGGNAVDPSVGPNQGTSAHLVGHERVFHAFIVAGDVIGWPPCHAVHVGQLAHEPYFVVELGGVGRVASILGNVGFVHRFAHGLSIIHVPAIGVLIPPVAQLQVACNLVLKLPIELWHHVVDPALGGPFEAVGIEGVIAFQAVGVAAIGVARLVAPNAKWANAQSHPWFHLLNGVVQHLDEQVNIVSSPVAPVAPPLPILGKTATIGKVGSFHRIGVEVVVHVKGVDVVACQQVAHHLIDKIATLGQGRVEVDFAVGIFHKPFGVFIVDVPCGRSVFAAGGHAIGVDPCVQLHASLVALLNHELQRVPQWSGGFSCFSRYPSAPWFELTGIGSVGLGAYLPNDGIHACTFELVELLDEVVACFLDSHRGILVLANDVKPCSAKLMFGVLCFEPCGCKCEQHEDCYFKKLVHLFY